MEAKPVVVEEIFSVSPDKVWKAITDKEEMKNWYFDLPEFKAEVGFEFSFVGGPPEQQYKHLCQVTEVISGMKLVYSWRYDGYEGLSYVAFDLFPASFGARLVLTHSELHTFPPEAQVFARQNFVNGWTQIMGTALKRYLEPATTH